MHSHDNRLYDIQIYQSLAGFIVGVFVLGTHGALAEQDSGSILAPQTTATGPRTGYTHREP